MCDQQCVDLAASHLVHSVFHASAEREKNTHSPHWRCSLTITPMHTHTAVVTAPSNSLHIETSHCVCRLGGASSCAQPVMTSRWAGLTCANSDALWKQFRRRSAALPHLCRLMWWFESQDCVISPESCFSHKGRDLLRSERLHRAWPRDTLRRRRQVLADVPKTTGSSQVFSPSQSLKFYLYIQQDILGISSSLCMIGINVHNSALTSKADLSASHWSPKLDSVKIWGFLIVFHASRWSAIDAL